MVTGPSYGSCRHCHFSLRTTRKVIGEDGVKRETETVYICGPPGFEAEEVEDTEKGRCMDRRGGLRCKQLFVERFKMI